MARKKSLITKKQGKSSLQRSRQLQKLIREHNAAAYEDLKDEAAITDISPASGVDKPLSVVEKALREYHEGEIRKGFKAFLTMGKHFYLIHKYDLFAGTWSDYCENQWGMTASGVGDLMSSWRTWKIIETPYKEALAGIKTRKALESKTETDNEADAIEPDEIITPEQITETPSQNAIDSIRINTNKLLEQGDLSDAEFDTLQKDVTELITEFAMNSVPDGKLTGTAVKATIERIVEILTTEVVEIEGVQNKTQNVPTNFIITQDVLEIMREQKRQIAEMLADRDKRLNTPQTRDVEIQKDKKTKIPEPTVDCYACGEVVTIYNIFHGGVQMACGCVYTMPPHSHKIEFDKKRTKANPLDESEGQDDDEQNGKSD